MFRCDQGACGARALRSKRFELALFGGLEMGEELFVQLG